MCRSYIKSFIETISSGAHLLRLNAAVQ